MPKAENKRLEILKETEIDVANARDRGSVPFVPDRRDAAADAAADDAAGIASRSVTTGSDAGWKVLVYMAAYGVLRPFAERDLFEMCSVEGLPSKGVRVVAQVHWQEGSVPVPHKVRHGGGNRIRFEDSDANPSTRTMADDFETFLKRELPSQQKVPSSQRCLLVLWGHAFAGSWPDVPTQFGAHGPRGMSLHEIRDVLKKFTEAPHGRPLDILGFDACDMSSAEVFDELRGVTKVLIGSQIGVPFSGWPYDAILESLVAAPAMTRTQVSKMLLKEYHDSYTPPRVTLTMLDSRGEKGSDVRRQLLLSLVKLGEEIGRIREPEILDIVRDTFQDARRDSADPLLDLRDFCVSLQNRLREPSSISKAQKQSVLKVIAAILDWHQAVVKGHERRGPLVSRLHGIGISPYLITQSWDRTQLRIYDRVGWRRPARAVEPDDEPEDELTDEVENTA